MSYENEDRVTCPQCSGTGMDVDVDGESITCMYCQGSGVISETMHQEQLYDKQLNQADEEYQRWSESQE